mmetsp:Transcript_14379/g.32841  ORF Transcript_14379/g.32841 Transcript_14379/m.32841 type:complete len:359 (+) Transcript_14379:490-1566(+)
MGGAARSVDVCCVGGPACRGGAPLQLDGDGLCRHGAGGEGAAACRGEHDCGLVGGASARSCFQTLAQWQARHGDQGGQRGRQVRRAPRGLQGGALSARAQPLAVSAARHTRRLGAMHSRLPRLLCPPHLQPHHRAGSQRGVASTDRTHAALVGALTSLAAEERRGGQAARRAGHRLRGGHRQREARRRAHRHREARRRAGEAGRGLRVGRLLLDQSARQPPHRDANGVVAELLQGGAQGDWQRVCGHAAVGGPDDFLARVLRVATLLCHLSRAAADDAHHGARGGAAARAVAQRHGPDHTRVGPQSGGRLAQERDCAERRAEGGGGARPREGRRERGVRRQAHLADASVASQPCKGCT